jgi:hypothetical protein
MAISPAVIVEKGINDPLHAMQDGSGIPGPLAYILMHADTKFLYKFWVKIQVIFE